MKPPKLPLSLTELIRLRKDKNTPLKNFAFLKTNT